jgi:hypothetical protein
MKTTLLDRDPNATRHSGRNDDRYLAWRETCARVDDAYRSWASETGPCRGLAFWLYMAALDAEEQAAEVYAGLVKRAEKLSWSEDPPAKPLGGLAWEAGS